MRNNSRCAALPMTSEDLCGAMARFDELPRVVRQTLANARINFSTKGIPDLVRSYGAARTARLLAQADITACRMDGLAVWGDDFDHIGSNP